MESKQVCAEKEQKTGMYGLPLEVKFCKRCVMSNQRPSSSAEFKNKAGDKKRVIDFDEEGICAPCRYMEKKQKIDWADRERQLKELLNRFRSEDGHYDVIVPGSGGKDSVMASYLLRYKYNMHPLLITWPPHIYTRMGRRNFQAWLNAGFDNITYSPNQKAYRLITKLAFENLTFPFQPFVFGQKYLAPKLSTKFGIPLVFYGENEAEYGNAIAENEKPTRDLSYYASNQKLEDIYLGGVSAKALMEEHNLTRSDLELYLPADPALLEKTGTEVHYLGYYVKWDPQECYYFAVENTDFYPNDERTDGSYSKYSSIDDKMDWLHYYTLYAKFGIGRATYDASQEIRHGHIARDEGVRLVRRFDGEFPNKYFKEDLEYMGISETRFHEIMDNARPPHLWERRNGAWVLKHQVG